MESLVPCLEKHPEYLEHKILERMTEPDRVFMFRVPWQDDTGRDPGQPRLPRRVQQRHRPVQGRPALPPHRQPRHPEVPRLRADPQEQPDDPAHGRRQGRQRLRPQGQIGLGSHALLPELHERAVPPHRRGHRRARRRHRRRRPRDRLPVRPVQEAHPRVRGRADRQGPQLGRLPHPSRGHRLRLRLLRRGDAQDQGPVVRGQDGGRLRLRQRRPVRRREGQPARRQGRHHVRLQRHDRRQGRHQGREVGSS